MVQCRPSSSPYSHHLQGVEGHPCGGWPTLSPKDIQLTVKPSGNHPSTYSGTSIYNVQKVRAAEVPSLTHCLDD